MTKDDATALVIDYCNKLIKEGVHFAFSPLETCYKIYRIPSDQLLKSFHFYIPRPAPVKGTMVRSGSWLAFSTGEVDRHGNLVCRRMGVNGRTERIELSEWVELCEEKP